MADRNPAPSDPLSASESDREDDTPRMDALSHDQTLADQDQTDADFDQTRADDDQSAADLDQTATECDEAAMQLDQSARELDLAPAGDSAAHDEARDLRSASAAERKRSVSARLAAAAGRDASAISRDRRADKRRQTSAQRDSERSDPDATRAARYVALHASIHRRSAAADRTLAADIRASSAAGSAIPQPMEASDNRERAARDRLDDEIERSNQIAGRQRH